MIWLLLLGTRASNNGALFVLGSWESLNYRPEPLLFFVLYQIIWTTAWGREERVRSL